MREIIWSKMQKVMQEALPASWWRKKFSLLLANQHHSDLLTGKPASLGEKQHDQNQKQNPNFPHNTFDTFDNTFDLSCGTGQIVKAGWRTFINFFARCPCADLDGVGGR